MRRILGPAGWLSEICDVVIRVPRSVHELSWLPFVLGLVIVPALTACGRSANESNSFKPMVDPSAKAHFFHHVVDAETVGGRECCSDVLAVGDIDGDGFEDIVVGGEHGEAPALVWYQYPTWRRSDIGVGEFSTDGAVVDFDGDRDQDVVIGDTGAGVVWFENLGRGAHWRRHVLGTGYAHDVEVGDLDGDDRIDVILADKKSLELWRAHADGSFRREMLSDIPGEGLLVVDIDADGDLDVLYSNLWLERTAIDGKSTWSAHPLAEGWTRDTRMQVADINDDGRLDVVLSASEGVGRLSWFEAGIDRRATPWREWPISVRKFVGAHSLAVADYDLDGHPDVAIAEMHTSPEKKVFVYFHGVNGWREFALARHGSHNIVAADVDVDGDTDLVGKNFAGIGRIVEMWENRSADFRLVPLLWPTTRDTPRWSFRPLDSDRPESDQQKFGLRIADVNRDGASDVVAGGTLHLNPRNADLADWPRVIVGEELDVIDITPSIVNGAHAILAVGNDGLHLATRSGDRDARWTHRKLATLPPGRTQGVAVGPRSSNGEYDLFFTRGTVLLKFRVRHQLQGPSDVQMITEDVDEAGVAVADLDSDGDQDVVTVAKGGRRLLWLEAEHDGAWQSHQLGAGLRWFDRVAIADVNGDGRLDIVYTEETQDWDYNARVGWLSAPADRKNEQWRNHVVAVLRSINSLDVHDVDGDGRLDFVVGEHTDMRAGELAMDTVTGVMLNRAIGLWEFEPIEIGPHSNHMGTLVAHLDPGQLDVVSMGWQQSCCVLRWRRDAPKRTKGEVVK